jgi:hypothetical protein
MSQILKNGAPDLWIGNDLYEVKRGVDRLSQAQRDWAQRYYQTTGRYVGVVHFEREPAGLEIALSGWTGRVFATFEEFDAYVRGEIAEPEFEFNDEIFQAILDAEYNRKRPSDSKTLQPRNSETGAFTNQPQSAEKAELCARFLRKEITPEQFSKELEVLVPWMKKS